MRKSLIVILIPAVLAGGAYGVMGLRNRAPVVPAVSTSDPAVGTRPYLVKVHSRWSPASILTRDIWPQLEEIYRGKVNFLVLDSTTAASRAAATAEIRRLGLEAFAEQYAGKPGTIVILDGARRFPRESIHGSRNIADYIAAIDAAFRAAAPATPINPRPSLPSDTYVIP